MGSSGQRVMLLTLTIDPSDPRFAAVLTFGGAYEGMRSKRRPAASALYRDDREPIIEASTRYASWAWNRFRTMLGRSAAGKRAYFRGLELQRSGVAHLHVLVRVRDAADFLLLRSLVRGPEHRRELGLAVRAGFGLVVDAQLARSTGDVARYVTKAGQGAGDRATGYATKGLGTPLPRYTRRSAWARSWAPGWVRPTPLAGFTWRVADASPSVVGAALAASGFVLEDPASLRVPPPRAGGTGAEGVSW